MIGFFLSQPLIRAALALAALLIIALVAVVLSGALTPDARPTPQTVAVATQTPPPTDTPQPPSDTSTSTNTPMPPTHTPVPPPDTSTPTNTAVPPADTSTPTSTPLPPTNTSTPTHTPLPATNTPTPTATPLSPTNTPTPTETPSPTPTPTFSPTPGPEGWLAYPEYDITRGTFSIKIYDLAQKQIIDTIDQASQPAISPNGQQIAYHSWRPAELGLFWKDIDPPGPGERIGQLSEAHRPQWKADNQRLIFSYVVGEIRDIRFVDQDDRSVPLPGPAKMPAWLSLEPEQLIFQGCRDSVCGLMTAYADGANPDLLTDRSGDLTPAPAPDGRQVAFMSDRDGNWEIYLLDLESRAVTRLTDNKASDGLPIFSPDGSQVAFVSDREGQWAVWLLDWRQPEPVGTPVRLARIPGGLEGPIADVSQELQPGWWYESISWWKK